MNLMDNKTRSSQELLFNPDSHSWLNQISNPPQKLFYRGCLDPLMSPCFSIVGTRRPSSYGIKSAIFFAKQLASLGFTIVSGLARGIDSYAHRGALMAQGKTVAVLGHGLSRIYPPENSNLSREIVDKGGCLISEYSWNEPPLKHHFPERNRIISGFSVGTLIIEAAEKSGSLITARLALEQNREVFVIPSRFDDESFRGGNRLLQEGAKMVLKIEDILEEIPRNLWEFSVIKNIEGNRFEELRELFESEDGSLSLDFLYSLAKQKRERMVKDLEAALGEQRVLELSPQHFIWIN